MNDVVGELNFQFIIYLIYNKIWINYKKDVFMWRFIYWAYL